MIEADECSVVPGGGLTTENRPAGTREVTLMSIEAWRDVCSELQADLPWHTRRANLLIEGLDLGKTIGQTLSIGAVRVRYAASPSLVGSWTNSTRGSVRPSRRASAAG